jgi:DNA-binding transcriptional LysR family regulator
VDEKMKPIAREMNGQQPKHVVAWAATIVDRLDALRAFVVAVDRGSLTAAAGVLQRSLPSVSRAIGSIEERVGARLLQRTTRSLKLTEAGERYLLVVRRVLAELEEADQGEGAVVEPQGLLTVTAPLAFGALHVRPVVDAFLAKWAAVRTRLVLLDRVVSVVEEGVDVAVRIAHLPDSSLVATGLGCVRRVVVASPAYLERHGRPRRPADLAAHRCIASTAVTPSDTWTFGARREGERPKHVRVRPVSSVNVAEPAIHSALEGAGVACALSYQVKEHLAAGTLVRLLGAFEPPPVPVHLVYPAASARTAKVRAFVELAAPRLREALR